MPVIRGQDGGGPYYKWGDEGKHYSYESGNKASRETAKDKALRQGREKKKPPPAATEGGGRRPKKLADPLSSSARSAAKARDRAHLAAVAAYRASSATIPTGSQVQRTPQGEKKKAVEKAARAGRG